MIADVEPVLRGVFCPVFGDIGEGGEIGVRHLPVLRFCCAHEHEAVCLHFRCEIDAPFVEFHLLPVLVKRQTARGDSGDGKPDVVAHLSDVLRRAYPVQGLPHLPSVPASRLELREEFLEIWRLPT